jgi:hypothetical protein
VADDLVSHYHDSDCLVVGDEQFEVVADLIDVLDFVGIVEDIVVEDYYHMVGVFADNFADLVEVVVELDSMGIVVGMMAVVVGMLKPNVAADTVADQ